jgi:hypothetical protein
MSHYCYGLDMPTSKRLTGITSGQSDPLIRLRGADVQIGAPSDSRSHTHRSQLVDAARTPAAARLSMVGSNGALPLTVAGDPPTSQQRLDA